MNDLVSIAAVSWEELQQYVYYGDGSWRDIYVLDASRADWKIWADFVNANCQVEFFDGNDTSQSQIDFAVAEAFWDGDGQANMLWATFFVGELGVNCHFFRDDEVENDIDPQKITSYAVHQQLMNYLTRLSQALGKEVVLTPENDTPASCNPLWLGPWLPLLSVKGEQVRVQAYWRNSA
ncbi:hypothetical protein GCM10011495_25460 [Hymenobacter frigidus]|uniref:SMI1/KNR4 family protein n=1 Tax=Hymenobacter frigidus TaxID=1524095 RepID=A0ABQ2A7P6_9BACT|nr:hypothetical protein [Hymenobacter frigidus]GGH87172.1 hypothetical protein GCM10011495_25460 [Hymenobacter frigidus]